MTPIQTLEGVDALAHLKTMALGNSLTQEVLKTLGDAKRIQGTTFVLKDLEDTYALGAHLARLIEKGTSWHLLGDLGAGKTTLVGCVLRALGVNGPIKSPTYALVESYDSALGQIHHADLYRLTHPDALYEIDFAEYLESGTTLIEWAANAIEALPMPAVVLALAAREDDGRDVLLLLLDNADTSPNASHHLRELL